MSKGSGMGRKRPALKLNKGMDKCDATSHSKQCGRPKEVSKGKHYMTDVTDISDTSKGEI